MNGAYLNTWNLDRSLEHSHIKCNNDYGFGEYDEETFIGGHTSELVVRDAQYNKFKMPKKN